LALSGPNHLTDVGAYTLSGSSYGTFDQGGNAWELNEALIGSLRGSRAGSWGDLSDYLRSATRATIDPTSQQDGVGLRIATIPEPSTLVLAVCGGLALLCWRFAKSRRTDSFSEVTPSNSWFQWRCVHDFCWTMSSS
jgi:hypothetical protein